MENILKWRLLTADLILVSQSWCCICWLTVTLSRRTGTLEENRAIIDVINNTSTFPPIKKHLFSSSALTCSGIEILSPLMSVSTLLSSITEFMLSIHSVSTGPSNTIHFSSGVSSKNGQEDSLVYAMLSRLPFYFKKKSKSLHGLCPVPVQQSKTK